MATPLSTPVSPPRVATPPDEVEIPLYSARLLNAPRSHRAFFRWILGLTLAGVATLFLPWQQNVQGNGSVTALRPQDRPQTVPTLIAGRIERWMVAEGQFVTRGTPLVQISEVKQEYLDPNLVPRTAEQVRAKEAAIVGKQSVAAALARQVAILGDAQRLGIEKARTKIAEYEAAVAAAVVDSQVAADQLRRREVLTRDGLASLNDLQNFRLRAQQAEAKLVEKRQGLLSARIELGSVDAEYGDKIQKARADQAKMVAEIEEGRAEVAKLRVALSSYEIRNGMYRIDAPQDGYVVRASRSGIGELVKEGDPIVTVQPAKPQQAVELYVKAVDVPLLSRGRRVRLQFDGWPALQFAGWPSVSVGTFGGVIAVVDYVNSADGTYRVLVTPDPKDEPWPAQLRMGSGVLGWAMLDEVRVWFELWRKFNGFPPSVQQPVSDAPAGASAGAGDASKEKK
jgi:adhesin transport system membrane fusion protein